MKKGPVLVDRTKPSTACEPCRKRRAKCDRQRPQCSQCIRSGNICSGYRDNLDLVIRNQNEKVVRAAQKKATTASRKSSPGTSAAAVPAAAAATPRNATTSRKTSIDPNSNARAVRQANYTNVPLLLKDTTSSTAVNYFVTHFGAGIYLDWLPSLFRASQQSYMLESSLDAVGTLYLGLHNHNHNLVESARSKYSVALQEITYALSVPSRAIQDDTIASVMLVALFSAWSNPASEAANTWTHHIRGAMILLDMRPPETFNGYVIQWLLGHVIGAIQLDCVNRLTALPPQLSRLCKLSVQGQWDYQVHFWSLIEKLAKLREQVSLSQGNPTYVLEQAFSLDAEAARLIRIMPLPPELEVDMPSPHRIELKDCPVHLPINRIVQALNTLRLIRLEMNHIIIRQIQKSDPTNVYQPQVTQAFKSIESLTREICDSVPGFLRGEEKLEHRQDTNLWICSLLWAFTFAAGCELVSEPMRRRVWRQLEIFSEATDMTHVSKAAAQVARGQGVPEGLHVFYLC